MYKIVYAKMASKDVPKLKAAHLTEKANADRSAAGESVPESTAI